MQVYSFISSFHSINSSSSHLAISEDKRYTINSFSLIDSLLFSVEDLSADMKQFLDYTYQIVRKALERYLYQVQQKQTSKQEEEKQMEINRRKHQDQLTGGSKLRSILRDSKTNSKKLPMIDG